MSPVLVVIAITMRSSAAIYRGSFTPAFDAGFVIDWNNPEELKKHIFDRECASWVPFMERRWMLSKSDYCSSFPCRAKTIFMPDDAAGYSADVKRQGDYAAQIDERVYSMNLNISYHHRARFSIAAWAESDSGGRLLVIEKSTKLIEQGSRAG